MAKLSLAAASTVLVLGATELVYRLDGAAERRKMLAGRDPDQLVVRAAPPPRYYDLKPGFESYTNSDGFRDLERTQVKPEGLFRIAVLGDSVTMQGGLPFEELYSQRLQARFDELLPGHVEILNFGVTGYNTIQQADVLENSVLRYNPDLVLWQFHDNDGQDSLHPNSLGAYYHRPASYLVRHITEKIEHYRCKRDARAFGYGPMTRLQRRRLCTWQNDLSTIRNLVERLQPAGVELVVMLYPSWPDENDWSNYSSAGSRIHRRITEDLQAIGAEVLDLLGPFRKIDPAEYRVAADDPWHPNAAGHRLMADLVFPILRDRVTK